MTVSVRDARNTEGDRLWIQSVYRDYLDDLAPGTGTFPALGEIGHREPDQLMRWFGDPNTFPLVILRSSQPVGFALGVRSATAPVSASGSSSASGPGAERGRSSGSQPRLGVDYRMAEFFITRAMRRLGIGATAVRLIFSRFAGRWEITEYLRNAGAVSFWRRVVASYTRGNYRERIVDGEVRQTFESGAP